MLGAAPSHAQDGTADCTISDGDRLDAAALCTVIDDGATVEYMGTIEENDAMFTAVINLEEMSGLLIGAGTFFLADGPIESTEEGIFQWPNGYVLEVSQ